MRLTRGVGFDTLRPWSFASLDYLSLFHYYGYIDETETVVFYFTYIGFLNVMFLDCVTPVFFSERLEW